MVAKVSRHSNLLTIKLLEEAESYVSPHLNKVCYRKLMIIHTILKIVFH